MTVCRYTQRSGALLVEVLIGLALSVLFAVAIVNMSLGTFTSVSQSRDHLVAINYAYEGLESIRTIARQNFDNLIDGTHGIVHTDDRYVLSGSSVSWEKYTMVIQIQPVYRDVNEALIMPTADTGAILAAGGWEDTQVKLATATVTWTSGTETRSIQVQSLYTKWFVYPLQSVSATGSLSGMEYDFNPIDGGLYPNWKALFWNADGGIDYMQVRVGDTYAELVSRNWIGPDGSTGSYYSVNGTGLDPASAGSGRWIQGKAWLTGTGTAAPILTILYE